MAKQEQRFGDSVDIPLPDDFHIHLRQGLPLTNYTRDAAFSFGRVLVMPNTSPPIRTPVEAVKYRDRIVAAGRDAEGFEPLMTFYIDTAMREQEISSLAEAGVVAGKLYPRGATTNSGHGVSDIEAAFPVFEAMEKADLVLCIHGELPDHFVLDRESAFLPVLRKIAERFPRLRIVLEHVSTAEGIAAVRDLPDTVAGTITVHHLLFTLDEVVGELLRPHRFCKPIAKRPEDRTALREAAFSADPRFFFGSDSAPHPVTAKECDGGCAGIYSAPTAVPILLSLFEQHSDLDSFVGFTARNGARFYGVPEASVRVRYTRTGWHVPERTSDIVALGAGERLEWRTAGRYTQSGGR